MLWFLGGQFTQEIIETFEAAFPHLSVALEPLVCLGERASFESAGPSLSVAPSRNQAGLL